MRPMKMRFTPLRNVDWSRLVDHLIAALFTSLGTAFVAHSDDPFPALMAALKLWIGGAVLYTGGYIQRSEKDPDASGTDAGGRS